MKIFAVFGNPIEHSESPFIHEMFAKQYKNISIKYIKILTSKKKFKQDIINFFLNKGSGANITSPFKEMAFKLVSNLTKRAQICGAVNTILKLNNNQLFGDNTDGIGLLLDLKRLQFIHKNCNILIIGAGGAARGLILPLLDYGCNITITNRTFFKAKLLANYFSNFGNIKSKNINNSTSTKFDLIINATSSSMNSKAPKINSKIFNEHAACYDIFYKKNTPFLSYAKNNKSSKISNGLGMLVIQAAFSFKIWFNVFPKIIPVLYALEKKIKNI